MPKGMKRHLGHFKSRRDGGPCLGEVTRRLRLTPELSGHGPLNPDGSIAEPRGKVGRELTLDQGYAAARLTALAILGSLKRALGELDRVSAWGRVFGMVNSAPGFNNQPSVINGFSDLILELYGPAVGAHTRSAVGMAELPFDIPVEIEAEVELVP